jgi:hypothetical protein
MGLTQIEWTAIAAIAGLARAAATVAIVIVTVRLAATARKVVLADEMLACSAECSAVVRTQNWAARPANSLYAWSSSCSVHSG